MRAIPNIRVIVPADAVATRCLIQSIALEPGPFYVRLARPSSEVIYQDNAKFRIGTGNILRDGSDATIMACGLMVTRALNAAKVLKSNNAITCRVVDMFSIKPIDSQLVARCARDTGAIVTAEEHSMIGGLGSAVAESSSETHPVPIRRLGVRDTFGESARDEEIDALLEKYGLTTNEIVHAVIECRGRSRR